VRNITFLNIFGIGQNANFISGRAPGNAVSGVRAPSFHDATT